MEGRIVSFALVVRDQAKSVEFYTERVGFEVKTDVSPSGGSGKSRYVTVGPKGQDLEVSLWELGGVTDPSQKEASKQWSPARSPPIVVKVADCRAGKA